MLITTKLWTRWMCKSSFDKRHETLGEGATSSMHILGA